MRTIIKDEISDESLISEQTLEKYTAFTKEIIRGRSWYNDGDSRIFWTNRKGNFKIAETQKGIGMCFAGSNLLPIFLKTI